MAVFNSEVENAWSYPVEATLYASNTASTDPLHPYKLCGLLKVPGEVQGLEELEDRFPQSNRELFSWSLDFATKLHWEMVPE
jgi:hypothetical protein